MGSGFIIGGLWGLIVSAGALAIASLMGEPPRAPDLGSGVVQQVPQAGVDEGSTGRQAGVDAPADGGSAPEAGLRPAQPPELAAPAPPEPAVSVLQTEMAQTAQPSDPVQPETSPDTQDASDTATPDLPAPPVSAEAPEAPAAQSSATQVPETPGSDRREAALPQTPRADVPAGRGSAPTADTAPLQRPRADGTIAPLSTDPVQPDPPRLDLGAEEPVLPGPPSRVIEIPAGEADITVATEPPPAPSAAPRVVVDDGAPGEGDEGASEVPVTADAIPSLDDSVPSGTAPDPVGETLAEAPGATDGLPSGLPSPRARPTLLPGGAGTITVLPEPDAQGLPGRPGGLDGDAVAVRRPGAEADEGAEAQSSPEFADDAPALLRFAAADTADGGMPRLSVVLIDEGGIDDPIAAASSIPFPVTIALDPDMPQAQARAAQWRAAGYEIAAMTRLPGNAAPSDVGAAYDAAFDALPETVALLDAGDAGLSADSAVTARALERLAQEGRGLAALSEGLATPLRQARGQGVPAIEIYRDLGEVGQDDRVIRRFLDQAAFRARQQGAVALMGRLNPETITALTLWGNRADREGVAPAPLSALLQMQGTGLAK